jgi:hypothetical protein
LKTWRRYLVLRKPSPSRTKSREDLAAQLAATRRDTRRADTIIGGGAPIFVPPSFSQRGFQVYPETPVFLASGSQAAINRDFENYHFYWFISDRMKTVLERFDPEAFAFLKCRVQLPNGKEGPVRWLCDVLPVLDALDEEQSEVRIAIGQDGSKVTHW